MSRLTRYADMLEALSREPARHVRAEVPEQIKRTRAAIEIASRVEVASR